MTVDGPVKVRCPICTTADVKLAEFQEKCPLCHGEEKVPLDLSKAIRTYTFSVSLPKREHVKSSTMMAITVLIFCWGLYFVFREKAHIAEFKFDQITECKRLCKDKIRSYDFDGTVCVCAD